MILNKRKKGRTNTKLHNLVDIWKEIIQLSIKLEGMLLIWAATERNGCANWRMKKENRNTNRRKLLLTWKVCHKLVCLRKVWQKQMSEQGNHNKQRTRNTLGNSLRIGGVQINLSYWTGRSGIQKSLRGKKALETSCWVYWSSFSSVEGFSSQIISILYC